MLLWQRGGTVKKTKNSPHPKRDEGCLCIKLRGTTQIAKDHLSPAAFGALTLRSVRFVFTGSSGVARNDPDRSTLQPWALSLDGGVCISDPIIAICHNFTFRKAGEALLCVQLNYSIRKTFVNVFSEKRRFVPGLCGNLCLCAALCLTCGSAFGTIKSDIKSILSTKGRNIP